MFSSTVDFCDDDTRLKQAQALVEVVLALVLTGEERRDLLIQSLIEGQYSQSLWQ